MMTSKRTLATTTVRAAASTDADFAQRILAWFDVHGRKHLPWQQNITPYRVWVSEIMLQQTQVATVIPYFEAFLVRFPSVHALAAASQDDVLGLWTGLGYYSRARNLHKAAQRVVSEYAGEFPTNTALLETLPGIGRSTAGAIASISMGLRAPILDGNVKRVLARHHALADWPGKASALNQLWNLAEKYTPHHRVADYTQAIMDLGATLCTRTRPACLDCPVAETCQGLSTSNPTQFPGKKPKKVMPTRETTFIIAQNTQGEVLLEQRPSQGIWGGLWSFPEVAHADEIDAWCLTHTGQAPQSVQSGPQLKHTFSHFHLAISPVYVAVQSPDNSIADKSNRRWLAPTDMDSLGLPAPVVKLLRKLATRV